MKWCLLFFISLPAWSYRFTIDFSNGFYWASLPISITVMDTDPVRKSTLERLSQNAINEWEQKTGLTLWSYQSSQSNPSSSNIIRWSENFAVETKMDPISVLAVAIRHTVGPYFARTEIVINGSHYLNRDLNHLRTTLTHELGHTMGLDHSEVSQAIMAPTLQVPYQGLHRDDVEGMISVNIESQHRQLTGYISPLAYEKKISSQPLSCATSALVVSSGSSRASGALSIVLGMLISFVRKCYTRLRFRG
jgi:hypothetical protein